MIAVFERVDNGVLLGLNSDYVIKVVEGERPDESLIEYGNYNGMAYSSLIPVRGNIRLVVAKLNGFEL